MIANYKKKLKMKFTILAFLSLVAVQTVELTESTALVTETFSTTTVYPADVLDLSDWKF